MAYMSLKATDRFLRAAASALNLMALAPAKQDVYALALVYARLLFSPDPAGVGY